MHFLGVEKPGTGIMGQGNEFQGRVPLQGMDQMCHGFS